MPHNLNGDVPKGLEEIVSAIKVMGVSQPEYRPNAGQITCWVVDTRKLWPGTNIWSASGAAEAMALISTQERNAISGKMFIQDARMSLASALVKRLYISRTLDIPWKRIHLGRRGDAKHGKPCAVDAAGRPIDGIDFNVSHQAGLVALIGWNGNIPQAYNAKGGVDSDLNIETYKPDVQVGVDIVCVNERNDYRVIESEGLDGWVDMYDYVFNEESRWSMKYDVDYITLPDGTTLPGAELGRLDRCTQRNKPISLTTADGKYRRFNSNLIIESKLRRFYAYFCYTEAYVKLAGEGLLADWMQELEFHNVRSPKPVAGTHGARGGGPWGEEVDDVEVQLHGKPVRDVKMKMQAFEGNFMISTAVSGDTEGLDVPAFRCLDLRGDIMDFAEDYLTASPSRSPAESP